MILLKVFIFQHCRIS